MRKETCSNQLVGGPTWERVLATSNPRQKWIEDLDQLGLNGPGRSKLEGKKFLSVDEASMVD